MTVSRRRSNLYRALAFPLPLVSGFLVGMLADDGRWVEACLAVALIGGLFWYLWLHARRPPPPPQLTPTVRDQLIWAGEAMLDGADYALGLDPQTGALVSAHRSNRNRRHWTFTCLDPEVMVEATGRLHLPGERTEVPVRLYVLRDRQMLRAHMIFELEMNHSRSSARLILPESVSGAEPALADGLGGWCIDPEALELSATVHRTAPESVHVRHQTGDSAGDDHE